MKLEKGKQYNIATLQFARWSDPKGNGTNGYRVEDYFQNGVYLGADEYGVEPLFAA